jgi:hypothetical protein
MSEEMISPLRMIEDMTMLRLGAQMRHDTFPLLRSCCSERIGVACCSRVPRSSRCRSAGDARWGTRR